jgi:hypothetical protein
MRLEIFKLRYSLLLFVTLISCSKEKFILNVQIFIVTNGAESIPLGLVSVGVTPFEVLSPKLDSALSVFDQEILGFENSIKDLKNKIESEVDLKTILWNDVLKEGGSKTQASFALKGRPYALLDAKPEFNYFKSWMTLVEGARDYLIEDKGVEYWVNRFNLNTLTDYYKQKERIDFLLADLKELESSVEEFKKGARVLELLGNTFNITKTNAQGNFSIELDEGSYLVFANSSRMVGSSTERYSWAVEVSLVGNKNDFFLSNDNLTSIDQIRLLNNKLKMN